MPKPRSRPSKVDRSKRRRVVNGRLLAITLAVIAIVAPTSYLWYKYQLGKTADSLLARAGQHEELRDWSQAASYYQRYLLLEPDDTKTLVRMVDAYAAGQPTPRRIRRLTSLLYRVLGRVPDRHDLRLMLAENLLKLGDHAGAEQQAKMLLGNSLPEGPTARKIVALSLYSRARVGGPISIEAAVQALVAAVEELPGDVQLATVAASVVRQHPTVFEPDQATPASYSDRIMDELVSANPKNVDARLARYRYRVANNLANAVDDLQFALEVAPENVEALLLSAESAFSTDHQVELAQALLRRAIVAAPHDARAYLALARLREHLGDRKAALELLIRGRRLSDNNVDLGLMLVSRLIASRDLDEAGRVFSEVKQQCQQLLAVMSGESKKQLDRRVKLLQSRIDLARGRIQPAITQLRAILASDDSNQAGSLTAELLQATALLARSMADLNRWDLAAHHWDRLITVAPQNPELLFYGAEAHLKAGQPQRTIEYFTRLLSSAKPMAEGALADVQIRLVQAHLVKQLRRPVGDRNWVEFQEALKISKRRSPERWELSLVEADYLLADGNYGAESVKEPTDDQLSDVHSRVVQILIDAESKFPNQPQFWQRLVLAYQRLDRAEDMRRALERFNSLDVSVARRAKLQAVVLSKEGKHKEADDLLRATLADLVGADRRQIELLRIRLKVNEGSLKAAQELIGTLVAADASDLDLLVMGIEVSLRIADYQSAERWENALQANDLYEFEWRYYRARRLLAQYTTLDEEQRQDLAKVLAYLRPRRPQWHPVIALAAQHAQLKGDSDQALRNYRLAVDLGDRRPETLQRLVSLLYQEERFGDAEHYLSQLSTDQSGNTQVDSLAISLALKQNRLDEALRLARESLRRHSDDPMRHVWLANLLSLQGHQEEAENVFHEAAKRFPEDARIWNGLFALFVRSGQKEKARKVLAALPEEIALPEDSREFVIAQGYEMLGELDDARAHYELAVAKMPKNIPVRLRFAKQLLSTDVAASREQFEQVLKLDPENEQARRHIATLLAATGSDDDWNRVEKLLDRAGASSSPSISSDNRLRALFLMRRGRNRKERLNNFEAARKILLDQVNRGKSEASDIDRILLAGVYEKVASLRGDNSVLEAAREQLRHLVDRSNPTVSNITLFVEFLLRSSVRLSDSSPENDEHDRLRNLYLDDADLRLAELKRLQSTVEGRSGDMSIVSLEVRLLHARGSGEEAADLLQEYASRRESEINNEAITGTQSEQAKAQLFLTTGNLLTSMGEHHQAENWYRRLMEIAPKTYTMLVRSLATQGRWEEAAQVCLQLAGDEPTPDVVATLAQLLTSSDQSDPHDKKLKSLVTSSLERDNNNIELLLAVAVMRVSENQNEEAVKLFRRVVELAPNHTLALNNLATLLAEQPNQYGAALETIERAISAAGRHPALLDTQGTIFLKAGNHEQAIACLEEATAGEATDPRYYFHLAAAYQLAQRADEARDALNLSRKRGLEKTLLTDDDRLLLSQLDQELASTARID